MTRSEALRIITARLQSADDDRLEMVASMLDDWPGQSVYDSLPDSEKAKIDGALDRLDLGQSISSVEVFAQLDAKLKVAGV